MHFAVMFCCLLCSVFFVVPVGAAEKKSKSKNKMVAATVPIKAAPEPKTGIEMVLVKGGCFQMGDQFGDGDAAEKPVHQVCVQDFSIAKYEVTQGLWEKTTGKSFDWPRMKGAEYPANGVSWNDAQEFITALNAKSGKHYRLPTEAEWEYAARSGGKKDKWSGINDENTLHDYAWFEKNSEVEIHPVGQKKPNALGLYDMSGNVIEWCNDWFDAAYYAQSPKDNPAGPSTGQDRVLRGGRFGRIQSELRTTYRKSDEPGMGDGDYGLRLVLPAR